MPGYLLVLRCFHLKTDREPFWALSFLKFEAVLLQPYGGLQSTVEAPLLEGPSTPLVPSLPSGQWERFSSLAGGLSLDELLERGPAAATSGRRVSGIEKLSVDLWRRGDEAGARTVAERSAPFCALQLCSGIWRPHAMRCQRRCFQSLHTHILSTA